MRRTSLRRPALLALAIVMIVAVPGAATGQDAQPRQDVLASLLTEVRVLRELFAQLATASPRVQLAMGRLQMQEQRLAAARRRLDDLRENIASQERDLAEMRENLVRMEEMPSRADANEREAMAFQLKLGKSAIAQRAADVDRLREQEVELAGILATEEGRWTEISDRLDELERALNPRR